jgi:hypothetical protein
MMHGCDALDLHAFKGGKTADQDQKRETYESDITGIRVDEVSCAKEVEALSGMSGHAVHLCHKVEALRPATCADGHGWQRQAGLNASD